jgi:hypothetical protein
MSKKRFPYDEISFRASGWMLAFYFGVIKYIKEKYKLKNIHLTGSSGGAIAACALLCNIDLDHTIEMLDNINNQNKIHPFNLCDFVKDQIEVYVQKICNKKINRNTLNIACTQIDKNGYKTEIFNQFNSLMDISNYLKASCHMPLVGGITPYRYNNKLLFDSIITDSHPNITTDCLKVSWTKKCECGCEKTLDVIRPYENLPLIWCLSPPKEVIKDLYTHGYYQAKLFFENVHEDENIKIIQSIDTKLKSHNENVYYFKKISLVGFLTIVSMIYVKYKK